MPKAARKILTYFLTFLVLMAIFIWQASIELPLPKDEQGERLRAGEIAECTIRRVRTMGLSVEIKMRDGFNLHGNIRNADEKFYEDMCNRNAFVNVRYHLLRRKWQGDSYIFHRVYEQ